MQADGQRTSVTVVEKPPPVLIVSNKTAGAAQPGALTTTCRPEAPGPNWPIVTRTESAAVASPFVSTIVGGTGVAVGVAVVELKNTAGGVKDAGQLIANSVV